jgi:MFS family permease
VLSLYGAFIEKQIFISPREQEKMAKGGEVNSNMIGNSKVINNESGFYGWIALAGAMLVYFSTSGTFFYSYGVFLPAMCNEYGWSRTLVGGGLSVALLAFGLPSPLIGASIAKFGPRANIVFGNLLVALGLAGMSIASEVWQIYLFYGIMVGLGAGFGLYLTCTTVVNNWFIRNRSLGMGLVISAGGLGGFLFPPLAIWLISAFGLHMAWLTLSMVQFACAVLMGGLILVRNKPEDMGQLPDGMPSTHDNEIEETTGNSSRVYQSSMDWQTRQAIRKPTTWLIATVCAANFLAIGMVTAHQVAYLKDIGFSPFVAAMALGLIPGMSIVGRLGFGFLGIRFEVRHLAITSFIIQVMALIILVTTKTFLLIYIYAMLFGISNGALVVAIPTFIGAYYGRTHYSQILGLIFPLAIVAEAAGPIIAGAINDAMGTYIPAFAIITIFSTFGLLCAILAYPPKYHE